MERQNLKLKIFNTLACLTFWSYTPALWAGPVSLTDGEILQLRSLAATSPETAQWAKSIEKEAQKALSLSPNPADLIQTAGKLKGSAEKTRTQEALKDMGHLKVLGLAYALTGSEDYRRKAEDFVIAWAKTCQPPENPIDATNLGPLLETYDLIRPKTEPGDRKIADDWVRLVAQTLLFKDKPSKPTHWNNWQSHRLKIMALSAFLLEDEDLEKKVLDALKNLLSRNLNPDGTTIDFLERDALHYQVYDLEPLIRTAILYQRAQGLDLYNWKTDQGASISQCAAYVIPYAKGEKTHAEYVHTKVKFDIQRAQNNERGHAIGADFEPKAALGCLELAEFFQPDLKPLVTSMAGTANATFPTLEILLKESFRPSTSPSTSR
jgi:hypothetical protein